MYGGMMKKRNEKKANSSMATDKLKKSNGWVFKT